MSSSVRRATPAPASLAGDSWPGIMWGDRSLQTALQNEGLGMYEEKGDVTAIGGSKASDWAQPDGLQLITDEINANPTIDIVHLSIGGNDALAMDTIANILANTETVVNHILSLRSDIRVLLVEYDFLPITIPGNTIIDQNNNQIASGQLRLAQAQGIPRFFYKSNLGLMQAVFGIMGVYAPGELPLPGGPPDYTPFAGGDPTMLSDPSTFRDNIHLSAAGYVALGEHCIDQFYRDWLLNPLSDPPPIPTLSQWGLIVMVLAFLGGGALFIRRRRLALAS